MNLADLLPEEHVIAPLRAASLAGAVVALLDRVEAAGQIRDRGAVERDLAARRQRDTVTVRGGVALPHARTTGVDAIVIAIGVGAEQLTLPDGGAARIVVLLLSPPDATTLHLQAAAALARWISQKGTIASLEGASSPADVVHSAALKRVELQPRLLVRDIMTHEVEAIGPDVSALDAINVMIRTRQQALPVLNDKAEVMGVVSESDILRAALPQLERPSADPAQAPPRLPTVRDIMSRSVLCVSEDTTIKEAANLMINKELQQFPVVDEGRFAGWVTRAGLIRKLFSR